MLILALDTSTSAISVGLVDGSDLAAGRSRIDVRGHSEHLAPLVERVLRDHHCTPRDLTHVVVGTGPGPFTGLRVGVVTGLTMGHALGIPVLGLCSLDALAARAVRSPHWHGGAELLVATDARRKEVYWARYAVSAGPGAAGAQVVGGAAPGGAAAAVRVDGPHVARPSDVPEGLARHLPVAGRGPQLYPELLTHALPVLDVDAVVLGTLAVRGIRSGDDMPVEPLYLRRPDALTTAERAAR